MFHFINFVNIYFSLKIYLLFLIIEVYCLIFMAVTSMIYELWIKSFYELRL